MDVKERAWELFAAGLGSKAVASELGVPRATARDWFATYRSGSGIGTARGTCRKTSYPDAVKFAAARDHVDRGLSIVETMGRHGIINARVLKRWCEIYRRYGSKSWPLSARYTLRRPDEREASQRRHGGSGRCGIINELENREDDAAAGGSCGKPPT